MQRQGRFMTILEKTIDKLFCIMYHKINDIKLTKGMIINGKIFCTRNDPR